MQGYSFDTFKVHGGNRQALETCRAIAALEREPGRPVLLLGPEGSGKSHLLWSMVKQVRARADKVGLALIMAHEFPDKVKDLVRDPAPIQGSRQAMLLVDGVEGFREESDALESVVQVFLRQGRHVVLTSNVHPDRLIRLTPRFRALLKLGHLIEVSAAASEPEQPSGEDGKIKILEREIKALRAERDQLDKRLAESAVSSTEIDSLRALVRSGLVEQDRLRHELDDALRRSKNAEREAAEERDALRFERDALKEALENERRENAQADKAQTASLQAQLEEARRESEAFQEESSRWEERARQFESALESARISENDARNGAAEEVEVLRAECADLKERIAELELNLNAARTAETSMRSETAQAVAAARSECATLAARAGALERSLQTAREAVQAAREDAEAAMAQQARLQGRIGRIEELEHALETANAEREAAREGNRRLADQAEAVLQQIERKKSEVTGSQQGLLATFQQLLYDFHAHGLAAGGVADRERLEALLGDADNLADAFRRQMAVDRKRFEEQLERARHEGDYAGEMLEAARAEQGRLRVSLDRAAGRAEALEFELEKARKQLALQVAEMDGLRQEAASQVAEAQLQAGEMEARIARLEGMVALAREAGGAIAQLADRLGGFAAFVEELRDFAGRWARLRELSAEAPTAEEDESGIDQATFFDAFEVLPEPPSPVQRTRVNSIPFKEEDRRPSLIDLVEEAFAPETEKRQSG